MMAKNVEKILLQLQQDPSYPSHPGFEGFVRSYLRHTVRTLIEGFRSDLLDFLTARFEFLIKTVPQEISVRVENPENDSSNIDDADGLADGGSFVTRVEVHTKDRPFLMTTVQEYFRSRGFKVLKSFHPLFAVKRDPSGDVTEVGYPAAREKSNESLVFLEVERIGEVEQCRKVRRDLTESLLGVRVVTDDFQAIRQHLQEAIEETQGAGFPQKPFASNEYEAFFSWLSEENFVFYGYRNYNLDSSDPNHPKLLPNDSSSLGILRLTKVLQEQKRQIEEEIESHIQSRASRANPVSILRTDVYSRVYRNQPLDYISLKRYSPLGVLKGEHVFVGSFSNRIINEKVERIPILREKKAAVLADLELIEYTNTHKRAIYALNNLPKEEVFYSSVSELGNSIEHILSAEEIATIQVFANASEIGHRQSLVVVMPKLEYNDLVKQKVYDELCHFFEVKHLREYVCWSEEQTLRLHYYISQPGKLRSQVDVDGFIEHLAQVIRPWSDRVSELLHHSFPGTTGERLAKKYRGVFREEYQQVYSPETALVDIFCLEQLYQTEYSQCVIQASTAQGDIKTSGTELRVHSDRLVELNRLVPILANFGLTVLDEAYTRVEPRGEDKAFIHTFHIQGPGGGEILASQDQERLASAISAILRDHYNDHALNTLILKADLEWQEVDILLGYRNYYLQLNKDNTPTTVDQSLTAYPNLSRLFLKLFLHKFSPDEDTYGDRTHRETITLPAIQEEIKANLAKVKGIAEDKILRNFWNLIASTLRTSYFKRMPTKVLSFKVRCANVWEMPEPRPRIETYIHGHSVEGIHLRGGMVSRGGLRWSDRQDDFRTEVLGLMKTQMIKNALIVPVGAKGGFFPDLKGKTGKDRQDEAVAQYRLFIRGLLEISDSYGPEGEEIRPKDVFAWDDFDPYLVVAADKGTATFSDIANELSEEYQFWLGDAFASGGSCGYSHKDLGITARGAWECVKRHFRELGKDIQNEDFTCVGIGDMGGDVFGNGMILSKHTRLLAAFNHLHIFLDPNPVAQTSFKERLRLFENPKLTWDDYDKKLISEGGGVFPRSAKVIPLSPQVREALGTEATSVNAEELLQIILKAPAELLWNGGIGTYCKSSEENHHEVRDKANDRVRVDASELRCKVVGEGGNLGFTQKARIEAELHGVRLNTDSIDNSGGVDLSDHEVNLKILMDLLRRKDLIADLEGRNQLLKDLTWETVDLVLKNSYAQSQVLSQDSLRSAKSAQPFLGAIDYLEREVGLDREIEEIGDDASVVNHQVAGHGIPRPKLAVLLAYAKRNAYSKLLRSDLPDQPEMERYLIEYFPAGIHKQFGKAIFDHRLRRQIIATMLANKIIDQPGMTYLISQIHATGKNPAEITQNYLLTDEFVEGPGLREQIQGLDNLAPTEIQYQALMLLEETIASINSFLLAWEGLPLLSWKNLESRRTAITGMQEELLQRLPEAMSHDYEHMIRHLEESRVPSALAKKIAFLPFFRHLLGLTRVAEESQFDLLDVAQVFFQVGSDLRFDWLQERATQVARSNEWEVQFLNRLSTELYFLQGEISKTVIRSRTNGESIDELLHHFYEAKREPIQVIHSELERLASSGVNNLIPIDLFRDHYRAILLSA
jgi:glutamate dehydrogenase